MLLRLGPHVSFPSYFICLLATACHRRGLSILASKKDTNLIISLPSLKSDYGSSSSVENLSFLAWNTRCSHLGSCQVFGLLPMILCVHAAFQPYWIAYSSSTVPCASLAPFDFWLHSWKPHHLPRSLSTHLVLYGLWRIHFLTVFPWELSAVSSWWRLSLTHLLYPLWNGGWWLYFFSFLLPTSQLICFYFLFFKDFVYLRETEREIEHKQEEGQEREKPTPHWAQRWKPAWAEPEVSHPTDWATPAPLTSQFKMLLFRLLSLLPNIFFPAFVIYISSLARNCIQQLNLAHLTPYVELCDLMWSS